MPKKDIREKFVSVFKDVANDIEGMDLDSAKEFLKQHIDKSKVNEESKHRMKSIIDSKPTFEKLRYYVWDAILKYMGHGVISEDEGTTVASTKLSHDLRFKVAEKLDLVAEMLEHYKPKKCACTALQYGDIPEFTEDMPVFLIVQEMPQFVPNVPFEPTEMPDFNIQDMPRASSVPEFKEKVSSDTEVRKIT